MTSLDAGRAPTTVEARISQLGFTGVQVTISGRDFARIDTMFALSSAIVAKYMRDVFGQFAGSHRRAVLAGALPGYKRLLRRSLFYRVLPKQRRQKVGKENKFVALSGFAIGAGVRLEDISMRIYSTSRVTLLHEVGGVVTAKAGSRMAIPVKADRDGVRARSVSGGSRRQSPAVLMAQGVQLIRRGKGLFRVDKTAKGRDRLTMTHLLTGSVRIKPALNVVSTWRSLELDRKRRLQRAIDGATAEMVATLGRNVSSSLTAALRAVG